LKLNKYVCTKKLKKAYFNNEIYFYREESRYSKHKFDKNYKTLDDIMKEKFEGFHRVEDHRIIANDYSKMINFNDLKKMLLSRGNILILYFYR